VLLRFWRLEALERALWVVVQIQCHQVAIKPLSMAWQLLDLN